MQVNINEPKPPHCVDHRGDENDLRHSEKSQTVWVTEHLQHRRTSGRVPGVQWAEPIVLQERRNRKLETRS